MTRSHLHLVSPPGATPPAEPELDPEGVALAGAAVAIGAIPWAGLLLIGRWGAGDLAVGALMAAAGLRELARLARARLTHAR